MKLVLLRHEERDLTEPRFFSPLTDQGILNSKSDNFLNKLSSINPDIIFCSPFERCLQTISPFCMKTKKLLAIENSLYEFIGNNKFIHEPIYDISNIKDFYEQVIDFKYTSYLDINQFLFSENNQIIRMESTQELFTRVTKFIEEILKRYLNSHQTILLVTHEGVIKQIETYLYQYILPENNKYYYIKMGEIREFNLESKYKEK